MREGGLPDAEAERLFALERLALLDSPPSPAFDGVTRLAAAALKVPILVVSLVDRDRLWFKSRVGLTLRESPRQGSMCATVVAERRPLVVRDARAEARFAGDALVAGGPRVRAYIGIPLHTRERQAVGTIAAMDTEAREFGDVEFVVLAEFAKIAEELLSAQESASKSDSVLQYAMEREKLFRDTFELAGAGIVHTSLHGSILRGNQHACALLGYGAAELRELSFRTITHPDDFAANVREFKRALAGEIEGYRLDQRLRGKDQRYRWVSMAVTLKRGAARLPDYGIVVLEDIGARKQSEADALKARDAAEDRLAAQARKLQEASEALQVQGARAQEAGDALRESQMRERETEATLQRTREELQEAKQACAHAEQACAQAEQALAETRETVRTTEKALLDAQTMHREAQAALQAANARLAAESATDALTVLPNRRSFSRRSEQAAQALRHARKPYGLILLDLDNLKQINEEYGHEVGDEVLRSLGRILNSQLRNSSDMAARLGGDEFAVLCFGDINEQTLHDVAERIQAQIAREPLATPKGLLRFAGSFGLALSLADDPDWKTLYGRADAALREAKAAGKDRISFGRSQSKSATARLRALSVPGA